jgi:hypothetical protein
LTSAEKSYAAKLALPEKQGYGLYMSCSISINADIGEQCAGGYPCEACVRKGKICQQQSSEFSKAIFVLYTENEGTVIPAQVMTNKETTYVDYFFAFLGRNHLGYRTEVLLEVLLPLVNISTLLRSVSSAIGALDASRHGSCSTYIKASNPRTLAYKSYSHSIESLKSALMASGVSQRDDVLWATFFLGLFEVCPSSPLQMRLYSLTNAISKLMVDPSGDGWAKHMLYGTSRLLQAAEPNQAFSQSRKAFLGIFKIFEANRAVLYGESTMLSGFEWAPIYHMDCHTTLSDWDSLGPISSIMVRISTFNNRYTIREFQAFLSSTDHSSSDSMIISHALPALIYLIQF